MPIGKDLPPLCEYFGTEHMNERALLLTSYVFEIAFLCSLIAAILVIRGGLRRRRAEWLRAVRPPGSMAQHLQDVKTDAN